MHPIEVTSERRKEQWHRTEIIVPTPPFVNSTGDTSYHNDFMCLLVDLTQHCIKLASLLDNLLGKPDEKDTFFQEPVTTVPHKLINQNKLELQKLCADLDGIIRQTTKLRIRCTPNELISCLYKADRYAGNLQLHALTLSKNLRAYLQSSAYLEDSSTTEDTTLTTLLSLFTATSGEKSSYFEAYLLKHNKLNTVASAISINALITKKIPATSTSLPRDLDRSMLSAYVKRCQTNDSHSSKHGKLQSNIQTYLSDATVNSDSNNNDVTVSEQKNTKSEEFFDDEKLRIKPNFGIFMLSMSNYHIFQVAMKKQIEKRAHAADVRLEVTNNIVKCYQDNLPTIDLLQSPQDFYSRQQAMVSAAVEKIYDNHAAAAKRCDLIMAIQKTFNNQKREYLTLRNSSADAGTSTLNLDPFESILKEYITQSQEQHIGEKAAAEYHKNDKMPCSTLSSANNSLIETNSSSNITDSASESTTSRASNSDDSATSNKTENTSGSEASSSTSGSTTISDDDCSDHESTATHKSDTSNNEDTSDSAVQSATSGSTTTSDDDSSDHESTATHKSGTSNNEDTSDSAVQSATSSSTTTSNDDSSDHESTATHKSGTSNNEDTSDSAVQSATSSSTTTSDDDSSDHESTATHKSDTSNSEDTSDSAVESANMKIDAQQHARVTRRRRQRNDTCSNVILPTVKQEDNGTYSSIKARNNMKKK